MENTAIPQPGARLGLLCVVSGPSGAGKTTLCRRLGDADPRTTHSVSCTTRPPREGEVDGRDYHFLDEAEFERRIAAGDFLEHARVHGRLYGTLLSSVTDHLLAGEDVVMDLDVQGAAQIRAHTDPLVRRCAFDIFVMPPDPGALRARLAHRATESDAERDLRLRNALDEMRHWPKYDYLILSSDRETDFARFTSIVEAERLRVLRLDGAHDRPVPPLPAAP